MIYILIYMLTIFNSDAYISYCYDHPDSKTKILYTNR